MPRKFDPCLPASGSSIGDSDVTRGMSERTRSDQLQMSQREILELAAGGGALEDVLKLVVRSAQQHSGDHGRVALFLVKPDGAHLRPSASAGIAEAYTIACDGFGIGPDFPSCGLAAHTGQTVIVVDVTKDPLWAPYLDLAKAHDIRACWSYPIRTIGGKVLGTIATYYSVPCEPLPDELDAVAMLSHTVAIVIERDKQLEQSRLAEQALRESHDRFETLFDTSPVGMYLVDADLRLRNMSAQTRASFGDIKDLAGRDFDEIVHILWPPHVASDIVARFRHCLASGESYRSPDFSADRFDTKVREYFDWQIHRIALPDGRYGVVCYFMDISARVLAEQSLRETEVRYRRLFETAKDGILILDATTGKITDANAFMGGLVGQEAHAMLGKQLHEIGMFEDVEASKRAFRELQANGYLRYDHLPVKNLHGGSVDVEVVANVYLEGPTLVAQCNVRDISQRVVMENKIKAQAQQLEEESRRKDEFLAMLSHEIRNPLAPIRSAVHLLKHGDHQNETAIQRQAREVIERQVGNLAKIVNDLLEISRVISERIRLDLGPVDLNEMVRRAAETASPLIEQRSHTLVLKPCEQGEGKLLVNADATRIEQVFVNLLNNAAKYTPDGGKIDVVCERRTQGGLEQAVVRVRDNGDGIDAALMPRLFDLFSQGDRSLARSAGGLGIGLALAHRLVTLHKGSIEIVSDGPGKGSEFVVILPLMVPATVTTSARTHAEGASDSSATTESRGGLRVLVVDDNPDHALMLSLNLGQRGYRVRSAGTGPEGLRIAQQWRPDVVLLDIGLPGLSGYEVARRLRSEPVETDGPAMRIIALSGYGRKEDIALAKESGFDAHLVKPVDFEEVLRALAAPTAPA